MVNFLSKNKSFLIIILICLIVSKIKNTVTNVCCLGKNFFFNEDGSPNGDLIRCDIRETVEDCDRWLRDRKSNGSKWNMLVLSDIDYKCTDD